MTQQFTDRGLIFLRSLFHNPTLQRTMEVQHGAVLQRLVANEHGLLHNFAGYHVNRPANITFYHMARPIRRRHRTARSAKVNADREDAVFCLIHEGDSFLIMYAWSRVLVYARIPAN